MFPPGLEPGTFRVLGERDNHYTTETLIIGTSIIFLSLAKVLKTEAVQFQLRKSEGPTEIRTRIVGFKVQSDSHYTIRPWERSYKATN